MARCTICKRDGDVVPLFEGILKTEMVMICEECADSEGVPLIRKPSKTQLQKADERYSVRERMEKISGVRQATQISEEQTLVQGNLARLKVLPQKQHHPEVLDNYYWTLNIARRRKKLSINQLAEKIKIDANTIQRIERGKIPENFEEIFLKIESFLGIKLLKSHKPLVSFKRTIDEEKEILRRVEAKMAMKDSLDSEDIIEELESEKIATKEKISKGKVDFSRRIDLENITLNDLVEMKKEKERKQQKHKSRIQTDAMLGDDLDLEIEEL